MDNHSMELINKSITKNNIEKIKKSMKKLKDTINRSNSNNYRNIKIKQKMHNNDREKLLNEYFIDENNTNLDYNKRDSYINDMKLYTANENEYQKIERIKKSPSIPNNKAEFNKFHKKYFDKSFNDQNISYFNHLLTNNNENNDIYSPYNASRNKNHIKLESKTDKYFNEMEVKEIDNNVNNLNIPIINESYPNLINKENSIILNKINNDNNDFDYTRSQNVLRNKSAKQMKIANDLVNTNNNSNNNFEDFNNLNDNDSILTNQNFMKINDFDSKNEYVIYLKQIIYNLENINKGLLQRYKKIINNFKSANGQNNILMIKINELKLKEQKIKNANIILEKEYASIKNDLFKNNKAKVLDKNSEYKKNEELKNRINKYDEIISNLKNKIKNINNENDISPEKYSNINPTLEEKEDDDDIINELEQKIENCHIELNEQEKILKLHKQEYEKLMGVGRDMNIGIGENNISDNDYNINNDINENNENENYEYINYINELKKQIDSINDQINLVDNYDNNK